MEVDRLTNSEHRGRIGRIHSDEQPLEGRQVGHRSTTATSGNALVGADGDDRLREKRAWSRVPGGPKRRIERQRV